MTVYIVDFTRPTPAQLAPPMGLIPERYRRLVRNVETVTPFYSFDQTPLGNGISIYRGQIEMLVPDNHVCDGPEAAAMLRRVAKELDEN